MILVVLAVSALFFLCLFSSLVLIDWWNDL
jgi:hypothetical protein